LCGSDIVVVDVFDTAVLHILALEPPNSLSAVQPPKNKTATAVSNNVFFILFIKLIMAIFPPNNQGEKAITNQRV
jgi:hypothetical protein